MQSTKKNLSDTKVQLTLVADDQEQLHAIKQEALRALAGGVKIQGFRSGKAPLSIVEKHVSQDQLHSEFLDRAMNSLYVAALEQENLRPVEQPKVKITKFVPYDTLELEAEVEVIGTVKLPDYKKFKLAKEKVSVSTKEVDDVIASLRTREGEKKDVERTAKKGDQAVIDFAGVDTKTKEPIKGGEGKDYPLALGSDTFIPGFEANVVGMKAGDEKTFELNFPKDYSVSALQNRRVTFTVTVKKVQEVVEPALDDAFAAKVGPFKTVQELKDDIKKELLARKEQDAGQAYADDLITKLTEKTKVAIPEVLVEEQLGRLEQEQRQNLMYRGQTWQEYLEAEGLTEESYKTKQRPAAELRVKAGIMLAEIAEAEKIEVTREELTQQMQVLKSRYPDPKMQAELADPKAQREIASRLLTEKTVAKLSEYAAQ